MFLLPPAFARKLNLPQELLEPCQKGEEIRNWTAETDFLTLRPYTNDWVPIDLAEYPSVGRYLKWFRKPLGNRATFSGKTYDQEGKLWYGYHIINKEKLSNAHRIGYSFIATHSHFVIEPSRRLYRQTAPIIVVRDLSLDMCHLGGALLNSSAALFWLKQVCFNKGAGEAYHEWNSSLPGHVPPNPELGAPFQTESDLRHAYRRAQAIRERLRAEMIALQEEMDWLVYAAYGLLPTVHPALPCHSEHA